MSAARYEQVADELRALADSIGLGGELPHRADLARQFGVSLNTLNRAMLVLRDEGRVVSRGRAGTVVAEAADWKARALAAEARLRSVRAALGDREQ